LSSPSSGLVLSATQKRHFKAEPLLKNLDISRMKFGQSHPEVARLPAHLGENRLMRRKYAAAEPLLRECMAIRAAKRPENWLASIRLRRLGRGYAALPP
jgi:hypothetical protein